MCTQEQYNTSEKLTLIVGPLETRLTLIVGPLEATETQNYDDSSFGNCLFCG